MVSRSPSGCFHRGILIAAVASGLLSFSLPAFAITVTAATSDNGYAAHLVTWTDASGMQRSAMMVDESSSAPYTGYLRQYRYLINGTTRICTGSYNYAADGHHEFSGDGFVQNHTAGGGDISTGNGSGSFPGTTTITLQGSSHAIITYNIPSYQISGVTVPTTIQWFFADGRSHPIFAITQDASASSGNLGADSRSPYGDMAYDGAASGDPITGNVVGGFSYGDQYKFATLATGPERVTRASPWKATESNTIPYAMQWVDPGSGVDAEMGHVATLPLSLSDQGIDTQTSVYDDPPDFFDPRTQSYPTDPLPPDNTQAYQIINETDTLPASGVTNSKRLTWGAQWGRVGGFDEYGSFTDTKNYSQHSTDPVGETLAGNRVSGALMAYSVFVVLGPHLGSYENGTVGQQVTQMADIQLSTLTATTGTVAASGPAGVGNASTKTINYTPRGYNPTYACWELSASNNVVDATLSPPQTASLADPVFLIDNYTAGVLPASISVGTGLNRSGTDYFVTLDAANDRLWITVNRSAASAINLLVETPYAVWQGQMFTAAQLANAAISGDTAAPAGDGIANLMKYALDLTPWSDGAEGLPAASIMTTGSNRYLTLTYTKVLAATDITYLAEVSTDLETWNSGAGYTAQISAINNPGGVTQNVVVQAVAPINSSNPKQFMRLQVTGP